MKKVFQCLSVLLCTFAVSYGYADDQYGDQPMDQYAESSQSSGQDGDCCAPADHACGDCYCLMCHYEPCYYNKTHCTYCPKYTYKKCCRYVPQYYQKQCCRYVPQYYCKTCCRQVPQYYYTCQCQYCPKYTCERCCKYVPRYYYKHVCQPNSCEQQADCGCPCPSSGN